MNEVAKRGLQKINGEILETVREMMKLNDKVADLMMKRSSLTSEFFPESRISRMSDEQLVIHIRHNFEALQMHDQKEELCNLEGMISDTDESVVEQCTSDGDSLQTVLRNLQARMKVESIKAMLEHKLHGVNPADFGSFEEFLQAVTGHDCKGESCNKCGRFSEKGGH
jgi:hypothetical protein